MTLLREIYHCSVCGNVVEVVNEQAGELKCCEKPMNKLSAKKEDAGQEKHVPVVEETNGCIKVKVGSLEHPMLKEHHIKFIEVLTADQVHRAELKPGQKPEAKFCVKKSDVVEVREWCNVHGLWKV
ncbi:MAG: desulfoferrodoxin [Omnitrophica WOR_2 bacterium GWF2_38_59]|nr:MAG: desulfoferrodoxin [Omnitrophica WOR_2 bacterium GWA2_37_7]OGX23920.1 MAG: desulfoferrodoxin [Omnitrophica WOR_2 bacterium GWF2_38_59]OGX47008.1 MAG: desulfoferrodoxin [Omnitrophica WOR_2 bacterium RIFOXYA2_FULL_38_17]OGX50950.1 MAG: desulfoferrodoxin [Omnitrophica WOR_2 bacterium RIFOXYA12_FULL_38_10]OGX55613.1 MAG: desulfoferrodoxin [Omnitrophica WOR_2 bacterium RIFOXYB2_FULL_38_16]OGX56763.1 MAG: desulfoferrodoxin [Omnitrophica WOR_2 bacterium RIFOXYC2_FULL_38_12]HBG62394.1 desulfof